MTNTTTKEVTAEFAKDLTPAQPETYWTPFRLDLKAWLGRNNAQSLGELYEGALRMVHSPNFPGRTRFVAHAVREIRNRLPETITGIRSGFFQWKNRLDGIVEDWQGAGFTLDGDIPWSVTTNANAPSNEIPVPRRLVQKVAILVKEHVEARERPQESARRLFEGIDPQNQKSREALAPVIRQWLEVTEWFMKIAHDSGATDEVLATSEFQRQFELFERALGALTREFFKTVGDLDEILEATNS